MKQQFMADLQRIYDELQQRQAQLNGYYTLLHTSHPQAQAIVEELLSRLGLPYEPEPIMAALTRIVNLREDALEQVLQKAGFSQEESTRKKALAYLFVSHLHLQRHDALITWIEEQELLTPFYRTLIAGVHAVGSAMSGWQSAWTAHIIHGINRDLFTQFKGDEEKIFEMLQSQRLLDCNPQGEIGDRCYSVLHQRADGTYERVAYAKAFEDEVTQVTQALLGFIETLDAYEDTIFGQKAEWLTYLQAILEALHHTDPDALIGYWATVDRAWMAVRTPLQIGHPLEYYEDHYRKAVALEWDLRIINPALQSGSQTRDAIKAFALNLAKEWGDDAKRILSKNLSQVDQTQLYIGQPMLYYGAEFNGLFSAQVVPNDEEVSNELGKKIFAYADFVRQSKHAKPIMKLSVEFLGEAFVKRSRTLVEKEPELWHQIYDISTIGHEFGHILWIDTDTESAMNTTGQFKNIEEFKATTGGLMAFFHQEDPTLQEYLIDDLVSRAVGLMAWREVGEVLPYYCEGLIHLALLFDSGVLTYEERITIDYTRYDAMREAYTQAYQTLVTHYLKKQDASLYLNTYVTKSEGVYLPRDPKIADFVQHYYTRYQAIGQQSITLEA